MRRSRVFAVLAGLALVLGPLTPARAAGTSLLDLSAGTTLEWAGYGLDASDGRGTQFTLPEAARIGSVTLFVKCSSGSVPSTNLTGTLYAWPEGMAVSANGFDLIPLKVVHPSAAVACNGDNVVEVNFPFNLDLTAGTYVASFVKAVSETKGIAAAATVSVPTQPMAIRRTNVNPDPRIGWISGVDQGIGIRINGTYLSQLPDERIASFSADKTAWIGPTQVGKAAADRGIAVGATVTYRVGVLNSGQLPLHGLAVTDVIPAGMTYVPGSASCVNAASACAVSFSDGTVSATVGELGVGNFAQVTFSVVASDWSAPDGETRTYESSATVTSTEVPSTATNVVSLAATKGLLRTLPNTGADAGLLGLAALLLTVVAASLVRNR